MEKTNDSSHRGRNDDSGFGPRLDKASGIGPAPLLPERVALMDSLKHPEDEGECPALFAFLRGQADPDASAIYRWLARNQRPELMCRFQQACPTLVPSLAALPRGIVAPAGMAFDLVVFGATDSDIAQLDATAQKHQWVIRELKLRLNAHVPQSKATATFQAIQAHVTHPEMVTIVVVGEDPPASGKEGAPKALPCHAWVFASLVHAPRIRSLEILGSPTFKIMVDEEARQAFSKMIEAATLTRLAITASQADLERCVELLAAAKKPLPRELALWRLPTPRRQLDLTRRMKSFLRSLTSPNRGITVLGLESFGEVDFELDDAIQIFLPTGSLQRLNFSHPVRHPSLGISLMHACLERNGAGLKHLPSLLAQQQDAVAIRALQLFVATNPGLQTRWRRGVESLARAQIDFQAPKAMESALRVLTEILLDRLAHDVAPSGTAVVHDAKVIAESKMTPALHAWLRSGSPDQDHPDVELYEFLFGDAKSAIAQLLGELPAVAANAKALENILRCVCEQFAACLTSMTDQGGQAVAGFDSKSTQDWLKLLKLRSLWELGAREQLLVRAFITNPIENAGQIYIYLGITHRLAEMAAIQAVEPRAVPMLDLCRQEGKDVLHWPPPAKVKVDIRASASRQNVSEILKEATHAGASIGQLLLNWGDDGAPLPHAKDVVNALVLAQQARVEAVDVVIHLAAKSHAPGLAAVCEAMASKLYVPSSLSILSKDGALAAMKDAEVVQGACNALRSGHLSKLGLWGSGEDFCWMVDRIHEAGGGVAAVGFSQRSGHDTLTSSPGFAERLGLLLAEAIALKSLVLETQGDCRAIGRHLGLLMMRNHSILALKLSGRVGGPQLDDLAVACIERNWVLARKSKSNYVAGLIFKARGYYDHLSDVLGPYIDAAALGGVKETGPLAKIDKAHVVAPKATQPLGIRIDETCCRAIECFLLSQALPRDFACMWTAHVERPLDDLVDRWRALHSVEPSQHWSASEIQGVLQMIKDGLRRAALRFLLDDPAAAAAASHPKTPVGVRPEIVAVVQQWLEPSPDESAFDLLLKDIVDFLGQMEVVVGAEGVDLLCRVLEPRLRSSYELCVAAGH